MQSNQKFVCQQKNLSMYHQRIAFLAHMLKRAKLIYNNYTANAKVTRCRTFMFYLSFKCYKYSTDICPSAFGNYTWCI